MVLTAAGAVAVPFPPPADGPVPFRRDRLPVDTDTIKQLAGAVRDVAAGTEADSAVERRALAQMLAVAMALDPSDSKSRELVREIPARDFEARGDEKDKARGLRRMWDAVEWLETPEAGIDGQALAACLKDVMVVADPKHERVAQLKSTGELAAWRGWVPVLSEYEERERPPVRPRGDDEDKDPRPNDSSGPPRIRLAQATVPAMFWKNVAKDWPPKWVLVPQTLTMRAAIRPREQWEIEEGVHRRTISIGSYAGSDSLGAMESRVENILRNKLGRLPDDLTIEISHPELDQSVRSGRRHALSGVCGALAYAAFKGGEPGALIIGLLEEDGRFLASTDFWGQLQPLAGVSGLRIVVPAAAEDLVMGFLAMEKPEFFFNNEVLVAKDLDEILLLGAKKPAAPLDGLAARFKEIQDKKGAQDMRVYTGNAFIRQRLQAIYQEEPRHLSAKALVIQALGKRPTTVSRPVLASEVAKALESLDWVRRSDYFEPKTGRPLGTTYDECKLQVERLTRYALRDDQALLAKVLEAVSGVRDIERASKGRGEYYEVENEIREKKRAFDDLYDECVKLVTEATAQ